MKCKPRGRVFYTEKRVNKKSDFQTSQKMLEVQVKGQMAVIQVGKCFEGEKKKSWSSRDLRPVAESKIMMGKGGKPKKNSGISIKKPHQTNKQTKHKKNHLTYYATLQTT